MARNQWLIASGGLLLSALGTFGMAQTRPISECAQVIADRGFVVTDEDVEDRLFEFEAIKNNQKWEIKTDHMCNVLLERIDD